MTNHLYSQICNIVAAIALFSFLSPGIFIESYSIQLVHLQCRQPSSILTKYEYGGNHRPRFRLSEIFGITQDFIILGGSGDLATTKIIPGLFDLCKQYSTLHEDNRLIAQRDRKISDKEFGGLSLSEDFDFDKFSIKLAARSDWSDDSLREKLSIILCREASKFSSPERVLHERLVAEFLQKCSYKCVASYDMASMAELIRVGSKNENGNEDLKDDEHKVRNIVYFALPPKQYLPALRAIREIRNENNLIKRNAQAPDFSSPSCRKIPNIEAENADMKAEDIPVKSQYTVDIVLEKPIGYDTKTAVEIIALALSAVGDSSDHVWCVDHYMAKDFATAIIPLKTSRHPSFSRLFQTYFNSDYISAVDVIFSDTNILDGRSGYFDGCGIVRDILQNHLIQLLALVCADTTSCTDTVTAAASGGSQGGRPAQSSEDIDNTHTATIRNKGIEINEMNGSIADSDDAADVQWDMLDAEKRSLAVKSARSKVLHSIPPLRASDLIVGQYDSYRQESGVAVGSTTSTFSSCTLKVPGPVWGNTAFFLTAGKGLDRKESVIRMKYRKHQFADVLTAVRHVYITGGLPPLLDFTASRLESLHLVLQVQPDPGLYLEGTHWARGEEEGVEGVVEGEGKSSISKESTKKKVLVTSRRLILCMDSLPMWPATPTIPHSPPNGRAGPGAQAAREMEAYTRVIRSVLFRERKSEFFPSIEEVLAQWRVFESALCTVESALLDQEVRIDKEDIVVSSSAQVEDSEGRESSRSDPNTEQGEGLRERGSHSGYSSAGAGYAEDAKECYSDGLELRSYRVGSSISSIVNRT